MSSKELYMIQNDKGEYLGVQAYEYEPSWNKGGGFALEDMAKAFEYAKTNGGHVVPLVEKPEPVKITKEEANMLERAKNLQEWRPASVIAKYAYEHERRSCDAEVLLEDRLMHAYINGWKVEKPKQWRVKVPHTNDLYWHDVKGLHAYDNASRLYNFPNRLYNFTDAEIKYYGLQDCEKLEVKTNE